jgi:hypothetical protein
MLVIPNIYKVMANFLTIWYSCMTTSKFCSLSCLVASVRYLSVMECTFLDFRTCFRCAYIHHALCRTHACRYDRIPSGCLLVVLHFSCFDEIKSPLFGDPNPWPIFDFCGRGQGSFRNFSQNFQIGSYCLLYYPYKLAGFPAGWRTPWSEYNCTYRSGNWWVFLYSCISASSGWWFWHVTARGQQDETRRLLDNEI